jgi:hypothetical protein
MHSEVENDCLEIFRQIHSARDERSQRRLHLSKTLRDEFGVLPRGDSDLCKQYIAGENVPLEVIGGMMKEMDFFVQETTYRQVLRALLFAHKENCLKTSLRVPRNDQYVFSYIAKLQTLDPKSSCKCTGELCVLSIQ